MKIRAYFFLFCAFLLFLGILLLPTTNMAHAITGFGASIALGMIAFACINVSGRMFIETYKYENRLKDYLLNYDDDE